MRKLTDDEIQEVAGGVHPAVVVIGGAIGGGTSAYLSGGSPGQIAGAAVMGGVSAGYSAVASVATGVGKGVYYAYSVATASATGLFTRNISNS